LYVRVATALPPYTSAALTVKDLIPIVPVSSSLPLGTVPVQRTVWVPAAFRQA
jgi:hypothetical protein